MDLFYFNFFIRQKGGADLFLWPSFFLSIFNSSLPGSVISCIYFGTKESSILKGKKSKLRAPFVFLNSGRIKSSFVKVIVICFSSYLHKHSRENCSRPVIVFDKTFPKNFRFDSIFVFDLWCISS